MPHKPRVSGGRAAWLGLAETVHRDSTRGLSGNMVSGSSVVVRASLRNCPKTQKAGAARSRISCSVLLSEQAPRLPVTQGRGVRCHLSVGGGQGTSQTHLESAAVNTKALLTCVQPGPRLWSLLLLENMACKHHLCNTHIHLLPHHTRFHIRSLCASGFLSKNKVPYIA